MTIGAKGIALIQQFEGLRLTAYPDPGTGGEPWTIGIGHTGGVQEGDACTEEQAQDWLRQDCKTAEDCIDAYVEPELTQNERDALISLIYNIGCGNFKGSTLLMLLNAGNMVGAANQFGRWDRAAGQVMPGLQARREAETKLFLETA